MRSPGTRARALQYYLRYKNLHSQRSPVVPPVLSFPNQTRPASLARTQLGVLALGALACAEWGSGLRCPISRPGPPDIKKEKHSNLQKRNPPFQTPAGPPAAVLTEAGVPGQFGGAAVHLTPPSP